MARFANEFGECNITTVPGCSTLCISHGVQVFPQFRGKGHGKRNMALRLARMKAMGYSHVLCTVRKDNEIEVGMLLNNNWKFLYSFDNPKTSNRVMLWIKEL